MFHLMTLNTELPEVILYLLIGNNHILCYSFLLIDPNINKQCGFVN